MSNIAFNNLDDMMDFLLNVKELENWETVLFRMSATSGIELNINTKITDTLGMREYIELKKLKTMISGFYIQNSHLTINIEIKLRFPNTLKRVIDPNDDYSAFFINFYADDMSTFAIDSFLEKSSSLSQEPVKSWTIYIMNLYNAWNNNKTNPI